MNTQPLTASDVLVRDVTIGNIIDIGAGVGNISEKLTLKLNGTSFKVHAIEPHAPSFSILENRNLSNITLYPISINDFDGVTRLYTSQYDLHTTNENVINRESLKFRPLNFVEDIVSKTLDTFVSENAVTNLTGINIDCDFSEKFVIEGGKNTFMNNSMTIALNISRGAITTYIYELIISYGYNIYDVDMNKVDQLNINNGYICKNF